MRFGKKPIVAIASLALGLTALSCSDDDDSGGDEDDDDNGPACAVASDACLDGCIVPRCGAALDACSDDATCDVAKDEMVSCICDAQRAGDSSAVGFCISTFTDTGGMRSTLFAYCATTDCSAPCGL